MEQESNPSRDADLHRDLIQSIAEGDREALARLYDLLSRPLYSISLRILDDVQEAEEVLQDVFTTIWRRAVDYDPTLARPFSWIIVITRRMCWNRLRARARHERKLEGLRSEPERLYAADCETIAESLENQDSKALLKEKIEAMPETKRKILELALYQGWTHEEIAEQTRLPLGTIKTWIRRGLLSLGKELGGLR